MCVIRPHVRICVQFVGDLVNGGEAVSGRGCDGRVSPNWTRQDPLNNRARRGSHNTSYRS